MGAKFPTEARPGGRGQAGSGGEPVCHSRREPEAEPGSTVWTDKIICGRKSFPDSLPLPPASEEVSKEDGAIVSASLP